MKSKKTVPRAIMVALLGGIAVLTGLLLIDWPPIRPPASPALDFELIGRPISAREALEDLEELKGIIERVHPDPFTRLSRAEFEQFAGAIAIELPASLSRAELWQRLSALASQLGDAHTSVEPPFEEVALKMALGERILPVMLELNDSKEVVVSKLMSETSELRLGDRILSIYGRPVFDLIQQYSSHFSGETRAFRDQRAIGSFNELLLLSDHRPPYAVTLQREGIEISVAVEGIDHADYQNATAMMAPRSEERKYFESYFLSESVAYINFFGMVGDLDEFKGLLAETFAQISSEKYSSLVIDLRYNGGGDSRFAEALLARITEEEFRLSSAKYWKASAEYREYLLSMLSPSMKRLNLHYFHPTGWRMFSGPPGQVIHFAESPESPHSRTPSFDGSICMIIGPYTFSSAMQLADAAKTYDIATLVGQPTGNWPNSFGDAFPYRLGNSNLLVNISTAQWIRANGNEQEGGGVIPDIEIDAAEESNGRADAALRRALECERL